MTQYYLTPTSNFMITFPLSVDPNVMINVFYAPFYAYKTVIFGRFEELNFHLN